MNVYTVIISTSKQQVKAICQYRWHKAKCTFTISGYNMGTLHTNIVQKINSNNRYAPNRIDIKHIPSSSPFAKAIIKPIKAAII